MSSGSPCASGHSAVPPPRMSARASAGSSGPRTNLINSTSSPLPLAGSSPDVPVVQCTQLHCTETVFGKLFAGHHPLRCASFMQRRTHPERAVQIESSCTVRTLRTSQCWHSRSWRNLGRRARLKTGCRSPRRAGSNPAERTYAPLAQLAEALDLGSSCWGFDSLAGHIGSLVKSRITLGFYP